MKKKIFAPFKDIENKTYFYTRRYADKETTVDSLKFFKEEKEDSNAWNPEFGEQTIHPEQECWWYEE